MKKTSITLCITLVALMYGVNIVAADTTNPPCEGCKSIDNAQKNSGLYKGGVPSSKDQDAKKVYDANGELVSTDGNKPGTSDSTATNGSSSTATNGSSSTASGGAKKPLEIITTEDIPGADCTVYATGGVDNKKYKCVVK